MQSAEIKNSTTHAGWGGALACAGLVTLIVVSQIVEAWHEYDAHQRLRAVSLITGLVLFPASLLYRWWKRRDIQVSWVVSAAYLLLMMAAFTFNR